MFALSNTITVIGIKNKDKMIKDKALEKIRKNKVCKAKLQIALEKSAPTIQRYLDENNILLTTSAAIRVIKSETGLDENDILAEEKEMETA